MNAVPDSERRGVVEAVRYGLRGDLVTSSEEFAPSLSCLPYDRHLRFLDGLLVLLGSYYCSPKIKPPEPGGSAP